MELSEDFSSRYEFQQKTVLEARNSTWLLQNTLAKDIGSKVSLTAEERFKSQNFVQLGNGAHVCETRGTLSGMRTPKELRSLATARSGCFPRNESLRRSGARMAGADLSPRLPLFILFLLQLKDVAKAYLATRNYRKKFRIAT
ncbi:hypothetical protein CDAR_235331 [Caerostris darwini]|uniref:Uncharacterized protein n=1 Tax=Caerostris darwini TaxID=1538125 RepID=A0AAV4MYR7_9ARAC|nr:hypothetical protein CDAR_235331 [Caerostris darwini]